MCRLFFNDFFVSLAKITYAPDIEIIIKINYPYEQLQLLVTKYKSNITINWLIDFCRNANNIVMYFLIFLQIFPILAAVMLGN